MLGESSGKELLDSHIAAGMETDERIHQRIP
jgi:hypothetical protein